LRTVEFHLLDTGHFALEEEGEQITGLMRQFLRKRHSEVPCRFFLRSS
jgi:hypothetical protein